jgi:survival of motor neuron protein-interacting protein 1
MDLNLDAQHTGQDVTEASAEIDDEDDFCGDDLIDLSTEAIAADAEMLEDVAYDTIKRPLDAIGGGDDDTGDSRICKKKKMNKNRKSHSKKESKYDATKLNESTTIEDLNTIDASAYLAWVNSQAGSLPSVFVAEKQNDDSNIDTSDNKNERKEHPIDGSAATLQILLSKQMDILPPPSIHHIPPACNAATFHINNDTSTKDGSKHAPDEQRDGTNDNNKNTCSNWVSTTISSFSKLRSYLEAQDALRKQNNIDTQLLRKVAVPKMKDRSEWHVFCLGREEAFGNKGGYFEEIDSENEQSKEENNNEDKVDDDHDDAEPEADVHSAENDANILTYNPADVPSDGYKPTSSLLLQIDQVLTRVLFHHHVHYLCEWKFPLTHQRAAWIYALLARMDKPWHRDECCAVRRVLRECCSRRWELSLPQEGESPTEESDRKWEQLAMLNTLIAITGIYYEQGSKAGGDGMDLLFRTT